MKKIILIGGGGHATSCIDVIEKEKKFKIIGIIDSTKKIDKKILNYKVIGRDKDLKKFKRLADYAFICVGHISINNVRKKLFDQVIKSGFKLPKIISPNSVISKYSKIGQGTIVHHGAIINAGSIIGKNCIINNNSLIEHDVKIGNNTHISTSVTINGDVSIGENSFIGSGAIIKNSIKIKKKTFVSMGKIIKKNI